MAQPTLRILYPRGVTAAEVAAAMKGVQDRFSSFGVSCEAAMVGPKFGEARPVADVYAGERIADLITSHAPLFMPYELNRDTVLGEMRSKSVFGLGITTRPIRQLGADFRPIRDPVIGVANPERGGIVSLLSLRRVPAEFIGIAIEVSAAHEAGHVIGRRGHCDNAGAL